MTIIMINLMKGKTLSSLVPNMIMTRLKKAQGTRKVLSLKPRISVQSENLDRELEQIMVFELAKVTTKVL